MNMMVEWFIDIACSFAYPLSSVSLRNPPSPLYFPDPICLFTVTRFVFTGDDYCVDSDDETEECKQRDTEENCNLLCDT